MIRSSASAMMSTQPDVGYAIFHAAQVIIDSHNSHVKNTDSLINKYGRQLVEQKSKLTGMEGALDGIKDRLLASEQADEENVLEAEKLQKMIEEASEMLQALEIESNKQISQLEAKVLKLTEYGRERDEQYERINSLVRDLQKGSLFSGSTRAPSVISEDQNNYN